MDSIACRKNEYWSQNETNSCSVLVRIGYYKKAKTGPSLGGGCREEPPLCAFPP